MYNFLSFHSKYYLLDLMWEYGLLSHTLFNTNIWQLQWSTSTEAQSVINIQWGAQYLLRHNLWSTFNKALNIYWGTTCDQHSTRHQLKIFFCQSLLLACKSLYSAHINIWLFLFVSTYWQHTSLITRLRILQ